MFPQIIRPIIKCTPIYVVTYGPAKLLTDFSYNSFIQILISQIIYFTITVFLLIFIYKKGVEKLNVNGG